MPPAHRLAALLIGALAPLAAFADTINVAAAISLKETLADIAAAYKIDTGHDVKFTFGSSGRLMAQIRNGAPIDAFVSAADTQVDDLAKEKLIDGATRRTVARNALVLIVPPGAGSAPTSFADLADPKVKRVAIGEPKTVPAGQYAAQSLRAINIHDQLAGRTVYGANVRQVLDYVRRGEVDAGIVYLTDAREAKDKVRVVATADPATHEPIAYPAVVIADSPKGDAARRFLDYLGADSARAVFKTKGFIVEKGAGNDQPAPKGK